MSAILQEAAEQMRQARIRDAIFHLRQAAACLVAAEVGTVGDGRECPDAVIMELADALERGHVAEAAERAGVAARVEEVW